MAIRPVKSPSVFVRFVAHNGTCGGVTAAATSFDDNYAITAGGDGVLMVHRIRYVPTPISYFSFPSIPFPLVSFTVLLN